MSTYASGHYNSANAYDEVPYASYPFPQSNPMLMFSIAGLFGLDAPPPENARVLELGCASGVNLMAIASCYPKSRCVGLDVSRVQIAQGVAMARSIGLANVELHHLSVMDVTPEFGTFDYIIVHGVLSWIPQDAQEKIMQICASNLSKNGVAYISYNTLPGWNGARAIREMMLFHTSRFSNPAEKVQQARWILQFMHESTKDSQTTLSKAIQREIEIVSSQPDYYVLHEHLEGENRAFYFHEFIGKANLHALQYLGDVSLETMFPSNLPPEIARFVMDTGDIIRSEQYMDFINDRRFRQTLLTHSGRAPNWSVSPELVRSGWLVSRFSYPQQFETHDIFCGQRLTFTTAQELTLTTEDPFILAMLRVLYENRKQPITLVQLAHGVREMLRRSPKAQRFDGPAQLEDRLAAMALRYIFMGGLGYYARHFPCIHHVSRMPLATPMARYLAQHEEWVANQRMEYTYLGEFDRTLLAYLDGKRDINALTACMMPHFESKALIMNNDQGPMTDMREVRTQIPDVIVQRLQALADYSLLVS